MKILECFHIYNQKEHVGIPRPPKHRLEEGREEQEEGPVTGGNPVITSGRCLVCHPVPQGPQVQLAFWGSTIRGKHVLQNEGKG